MKQARPHTLGFTLVELAVVLIIIGIVVSSAVVMGKTAIEAAQQQQTMVKMAAIRQALYTWRKAYDRLPCPASLTLATTSANFGVEGPKAANCIDGVAGNATSTNNTGTNTVSEGAVPVRTLGLSDDTALDGWGNRIRYAVSVPFTTTAAFTTYAVNNTSASAIKMLDGTGASNYRTQTALFALIGAGADKYGAYNKVGTLVTSTTTVHADEQQNCHCNSGGATAYDGKYVQRATVTSSAANYYDDIVDYGMRWQMQTALDAPTSNYTYYAAITIDHTKVPNTDQTNFPMLFSGTYAGASGAPDLRVTGSGGAVTSNSGYDIIFATSNTCGTPLAFEQESYTSTTGAVNYWVKIPTLSHITDTVIYLCYGNSAITTTQATPSGVWDSDFKGVWHLPNGSSLTALDSTSSADNGTVNSATATTGKVGGAASVNGSQNVDMGTSKTALQPTSAVTVEAWVKPNSNSQNAYSLIVGQDYSNPRGNPYYGYKLGLAHASFPTMYDLEYDVGGASTALSSGVAFANGTWVHMVGVITNASQKIYINGAQVASAANAAVLAYSNGNFRIGQNSTGSDNANITVDEVRVSDIARSADWITSEYNNQSSPSTFYTLGTVTAM